MLFYRSRKNYSFYNKNMAYLLKFKFKNICYRVLEEILNLQVHFFNKKKKLSDSFFRVVYHINISRS